MTDRIKLMSDTSEAVADIVETIQSRHGTSRARAALLQAQAASLHYLHHELCSQLATVPEEARQACYHAVDAAMCLNFQDLQKRLHEFTKITLYSGDNDPERAEVDKFVEQMNERLKRSIDVFYGERKNG